MRALLGPTASRCRLRRTALTGWGLQWSSQETDFKGDNTMATAYSTASDASTIASTFYRSGPELRVQFTSFTSPDNGFSLAELDALEQAIAAARRSMTEALTAAEPELAVFRPASEDDATLRKRYHEQLRKTVPVPT